MKQFLRHISLFVAMFVATTSLTAQTYNGDTWYSLYDDTEESVSTTTSVNDNKTICHYDVFAPSTGVLSFDTKMSKADLGLIKVDPAAYSILVAARTIDVAKAQTSYTTKSTTIDASLTSLDFRLKYDSYNSGRKIYINNVKLPLATHILLSNGTTSDNKTFNQTKVGSSSENIKINLRSFLTNKTGTNGITIKSSNSVFRIVNADANNVLTWNVGANACASSNGNDGVDAKGGTLGDIDKYFFEIYFKPTEATKYNEKITISDGYSTATINVFGTGLKKDQNINWSIECSADNVTMPIGQAIIDAATATSGGEVTYYSVDPEVIRVEGNKLIALKKGSTIITARQAGDDKVWNSCEDDKTFTVTDNKIQYIEWLDNFTHLRVDDGEVDLTATAKILVNVLTNEVIDAPERTPLISYKSNDENIVLVQGQKLIIKGVEGETTVTATLPATDGYESVSISKPVRVLAKATGCDILIPHTGASATGKLVWDATEGGSKNITIDLSRGIPEKLSFTYRGEVFGAEFTKILTGAIKVEASEDGNSWSLLKDGIKTKDDEFGDDILMTNLPTLSNKTKYIRFTRYDNNSWTSNYGTYVINNIEITPARFIEVNNEELVPRDHVETTIDFGDVFIGYSYEPKSFYLTYSDVQNISLKKNNSQIRLSEELIPIECGQFTPLGTSREIKITLNPTTEGQINETITITDEAKTKTAKVMVKANVKRVTFEGYTDDPDWKENDNWNCGKFPNDIRIPITIKADVTLREGTFAVKEVKFENDAKLHITHKSGLTIGEGGVIDAKDGTVTIDNLPEGAGFLRIDPSATNKLTNKVEVKYTTKAFDGVWQYFGAPGTDAVISNEPYTDVYLWSEPKGWMQHTLQTLQPFEGYAITQYNGENKTYSMTATPICGDKTINLTKSADGMNGDNLFVNSYLAPIDLTKFTDMDDDLNDPNDDFRGNFEKTFYLFNSGSWEDWQGNGGSENNGFVEGGNRGQYFAITPLSVKLLDSNIEQTVIPSMQGVYVIANENGASIKLDYNKHVFKADAANMNYHMRAPKVEDKDFMRVRMQVGSQNSGSDRMYVIQYKEGTQGFDNGYDARNILVDGLASIYTNEQDGEMEISVSDNINETYIGFSAGNDGEYTLRFTSVVGELYLKDLETETVWAVMDGEEYTFYATPNTKNDRRFLLLDHKPEQSGGVSTGVENVHSTKAWIADNVVYVTNAPINTELVVYTMSGVVVTSLVTTTPYTTIDVANMPTGVYMLRLNDKVYKFVCK